MKLRPENPALTEKRTIHPKMRKEVTGKTLLKPVSNNAKLGGGASIVTKGKWRGYPMFSLTLEERATCPPYCHHWMDCFGNNMAFAHRFVAGPELEAKIQEEVANLAKLYRNFVIRLHILGDFYSQGYVIMWHKLMEKYPGLHVFGYSAHFRTPKITDELMAIRTRFADRWWVRFSHNGESDSNTIFAAKEDYTGPSITCPEQTGDVPNCLACGICWAANKTVRFLSH